MIRKANKMDLNKIINLYIDVTGHLEKNTNYPNWKKHEYPNEETAKKALEENSLFVYTIEDEIVGSGVLNQDQPEPYSNAKWLTNFSKEEILTIHTLLVSPNHCKKGIGKSFILFAEKFGKENGYKSIRLDTYEDNIPAQKLYENNGYSFCGKINLKPDRSVKLYNTYEKIL